MDEPHLECFACQCQDDQLWLNHGAPMCCCTQLFFRDVRRVSYKLRDDFIYEDDVPEVNTCDIQT